MDDDGQLFLTPGPATVLLSLLGPLWVKVSWEDAALADWCRDVRQSSAWLELLMWGQR